MTEPARLLGVDYGTVRIGLAVSDPDRKIAFPLEVRDRALDERLPDPGDLLAQRLRARRPFRLRLDPLERGGAVGCREAGQPRGRERR